MKPSRALCTCFYHFIRNKQALLKTLAGSQSELYRIFAPAGGTEGRRAVISTFRILRGKGGMEGSEERRENYCLEGFTRTNVCGSWCFVSGVNVCSTARFYHRVLRWHFKDTSTNSVQCSMLHDVNICKTVMSISNIELALVLYVSM
jgi:hypothetical protein